MSALDAVHAPVLAVVLWITQEIRMWIYWTIVLSRRYCSTVPRIECVRWDARRSSPKPLQDRQCLGTDCKPRRAAIVTRSGSESAFILRITWALWAFTVISLMPSSLPTCLFN